MKKIMMAAAVLTAGILLAAAAFDNCTAMLTSAATAAINTTTDVSAAARSINTINMSSAACYLYAKGDNAACAGTIGFYLDRSPDGGTTWSRLPVQNVTLSGTTAVVGTVDLDLTNTRSIRLGAVSNSETVAGRTATIQAYIQFKP